MIGSLNMFGNWRGKALLILKLNGKFWPKNQGSIEKQENVNYVWEKKLKFWDQFIWNLTKLSIKGRRYTEGAYTEKKHFLGFLLEQEGSTVTNHDDHNFYSDTASLTQNPEVLPTNFEENIGTSVDINVGENAVEGGCTRSGKRWRGAEIVHSWKHIFY